jgi:hypothetical protein
MFLFDCFYFPLLIINRQGHLPSSSGIHIAGPIVVAHSKDEEKEEAVS